MMTTISVKRWRAPLSVLQRLALQQPRHLSGQARRLADEQVLQRRRAVDQAETNIAHGAQQRQFVGEQQIERIGGEPIAMVSNRRQR